MRLWAWLWSGKGTCPWELTELRLCRDVYHCTPSQLDEQDWLTVAKHLLCASVEAKVQSRKTRPKK